MSSQAKKKKRAYPARRKFKITEFITHPDLWWAVYFFMVFQLAVYLIGLAAVQPNSTPFTIGGIGIGIYVISHAFKMAQSRQLLKNRYDAVSKGRILVVVLGLFVFIYAASILLIMLGIPPTVQPNQEAIETVMLSQRLPMMFLSIGVAPVVEELVFRELLPHAGGRSVWSFVISSILFAAMHAPAGISGWVVYSGLSFGFLYLRLKGNNILEAMGGHILYNGISMLSTIL